MTRIVMLVIGYCFLFLGVLGLFLPFLQGILFLIVGLLILARYAAWAQKVLDWLKERHPKIADMIVHAEGIADRWVLGAEDRIRGFWRRIGGNA
jgi:uncharacterized membrane protein YbaN (DUF454 family)